MSALRISLSAASEARSLGLAERALQALAGAPSGRDVFEDARHAGHAPALVEDRKAPRANPAVPTRGQQHPVLELGLLLLDPRLHALAILGVHRIEEVDLSAREVAARAPPELLEGRAEVIGLVGGGLPQDEQDVDVLGHLPEQALAPHENRLRLAALEALAAEREEGTRPQEELGGVHGLAQEIVGGRGDEPLQRRGIVVRGHQHDGHVGPAGEGPQPLAHREAVEARHLDVEQHEVDRPARERLERTRTILGAQDVVPAPRSSSARTDSRSVVIDDENVLGGHAWGLLHSDGKPGRLLETRAANVPRLMADFPVRGRCRAPRALLDRDLALPFRPAALEPRPT
jgi:hypothetical protein